MSRVLVRVDAVKVSGLDRAGAAALPGRLEGAVRRSIERTPPERIRGTTDVPVIRVCVDRRSAVSPDRVGEAVATAIGAAARRRGGGR